MALFSLIEKSITTRAGRDLSTFPLFGIFRNLSINEFSVLLISYLESYIFLEPDPTRFNFKFSGPGPVKSFGTGSFISFMNSSKIRSGRLGTFIQGTILHKILGPVRTLSVTCGEAVVRYHDQ